MNLYQTQHPFYCGIDLHANKMYACVVDSTGKKTVAFELPYARHTDIRAINYTFQQKAGGPRHRLRKYVQLVLAV